MRLEETLEQEISDAGAQRFNMDLGGSVEGLIIGENIIVERALSERRRNRVTRHEIEHLYTCQNNLMHSPPLLREKLEAVAERRALVKLVPLAQLVRLWRQGAREPWEFASALEIDGEYFLRAISAYEGIFGAYAQVGDSRVYFSPFRVD